MSHLLVFGASGRTGRHLTELACAAGLDPLPVVRDIDAADRLGFGDGALVADLRDADSVERALYTARPRAVISVAGGRGDLWVDGEGSIGLIEACVAAGVERFILVTSLGCGDSAEHASPALLRAIGAVLREKTRAEAHLATTTLAWTTVRPGGLTETPATGGGALLHDIDKMLSEQTGLPIVITDDPLTCVVRGCGRALVEAESLGDVFVYE